VRRVVLGLLFLSLLAPGCSAAKLRANDARAAGCPQPTFSNYRKGGPSCDLEELRVAGYKVAEPACTEGCPLMAGAHRVDITPPPGFPMGGSGFIAHFGRGYWTRLYARAFFFRGGNGQSLAFVSCDLGTMAAGLQARVAELLHDQEERGEPKLNLSRENLILSATHVHQGPGNFMSYKLYNDVGSPAAGFDRKLFEKLAERISEAIRKAARKADDAAGTTTTVLRLKEGRVQNLLRNRAPAPFMLNPDRDTVLGDGPAYSCDPHNPLESPYPRECPRLKAVDERVAVLEIHRTPKAGGIDEHVGSMVFLSVHPEAMSHETELHQSDFTGLAMTLLEGRNPEKFVAGFFNGADGDISVRWDQQNRNEAVRFAGSLRGVLEGLETQKAAVEFDSQAAFTAARFEIPSNCYFTEDSGARNHYEPWCTAKPGDDPDDQRICIAGEPMYGAAALGGAEDARSPMFDLGWKAGARKVPWDLQGVKREAFEAAFLPINLTWLVARPCFYAETIPLSLVRFRGKEGAALDFGILPAELTRTAWWRIERAMKAQSRGRILPIGLANEYIGYVTTREEYGAQAYEGASTIYGPYAAEVLQARLLDLARNLHEPAGKGSVVEPAVFYPDRWGAGRSFGPEEDEMRAAHGDPDEALDNLILDENGLPERHWPRFEWSEDGIDDWTAGERRIRILKGSSSRVADDDSGPNILTVYVNPTDRTAHEPKATFPLFAELRLVKVLEKSGTQANPKHRRWTAIWLAPKGGNEDDKYSFSVTLAGKTGSRICSEEFKIKEVMGRPPGPVKAAACPP
jgi:neutral ceramidase